MQNNHPKSTVDINHTHALFDFVCEEKIKNNTDTTLNKPYATTQLKITSTTTQYISS